MVRARARQQPQPLPDVQNDHGMLVYGTGAHKRCLGYLLVSAQYGVLDATFGRVAVEPAAAEEHNRLLSQAEIAGLDANCEVGMQGTLYFHSDGRVQTWLGDIVSEAVVRRGHVVTFGRNGKTYRGRLTDSDLLRFRRIR
jgi:hypothetical protein